MTDHIDLTEGPFGQNFTVGMRNASKRLAAKVGSALTRRGSQANAYYQGVDNRIEIVQVVKAEYARWLAETRQKATASNFKTFIKKTFGADINGLLKDYHLVSTKRDVNLSPDVKQQLDQFTNMGADTRHAQDAGFEKIINVLEVSYEAELAPETILMLTRDLLKQASKDKTGYSRDRLKVFFKALIQQPEYNKLMHKAKPHIDKLVQEENKSRRLFANFREGVVEFAATLVEERCTTPEQISALYKIIFEDVFLDPKTLDALIHDVISGKHEEPANRAAFSAKAEADQQQQQGGQEQQQRGQQAGQPQQPQQQQPPPAPAQHSTTLDSKRLGLALRDAGLSMRLADEVIRTLRAAENNHRDKDKAIRDLAAQHKVPLDKLLLSIVNALK